MYIAIWQSDLQQVYDNLGTSWYVYAMCVNH